MNNENTQNENKNLENVMFDIYIKTVVVGMMVPSPFNHALQYSCINRVKVLF